MSILLLLNKSVILGAILNLNTLVFVNYLNNNTYVLHLVVCGSLLIGALGAVYQSNLSRLLAYSSITHTGFLLSPLLIYEFVYSYIVLYYYLINYMIILLTFLVFLSYFDNNKYFNQFINNIVVVKGSDLSSSHSYLKISTNSTKSSHVSHLSGLYYSNPLLCFYFIILLFTMAGLPPFVGFFTKAYLIRDLFRFGLYFIIFVMLLTSLIGFIYYLNLIKTVSTESNNFLLISTKKDNTTGAFFFITFLVIFFILSFNDPFDIFTEVVIFMAKSFHVETD